MFSQTIVTSFLIQTKLQFELIKDIWLQKLNTFSSMCHEQVPKTDCLVWVACNVFKGESWFVFHTALDLLKGHPQSMYGNGGVERIIWKVAACA